MYLHKLKFIVSGLFTNYSISPQVYLIDYGLACRFTWDGNHKVYEESPKRRHDGTIEVTSRDAHNGAGKQNFSRS